MTQDGPPRARETTSEINHWIAQARSVRQRRHSVHAKAFAAVEKLRQQMVQVSQDGRPGWRVIPVGRRQGGLLAAFARHSQLPTITADEERLLTWVTDGVAAAARDLRRVTGARRLLSGSTKRVTGQQAAEFLSAFRRTAHENRLPELLNRHYAHEYTLPKHVVPSSVDTNALDLGWRFSDLGPSPTFTAVPGLGELPRALKILRGALKRETKLRSAVQRDSEAVRRRDTALTIARMPVERLKETAPGLLRFAPLRSAGIKTVQEVIYRSARLERIHGIGPTTAGRLRAAARAMQEETFRHMPVRLEGNTPETAKLLASLRALDAVRRLSDADLRRAQELEGLARRVHGTMGHAIVIPIGDRPAIDLLQIIENVIQSARAIPAAVDPWQDFRSRPHDYYASLSATARPAPARKWPKPPPPLPLAAGRPAPTPGSASHQWSRNIQAWQKSTTPARPATTSRPTPRPDHSPDVGGLASQAWPTSNAPAPPAITPEPTPRPEPLSAELQALIGEVNDWHKQAQKIRLDRAELEQAVQDALRTFRRNKVELPGDGHPDWRVLRLDAGSTKHLGAIAQHFQAPPITPNDERWLNRLSDELPAIVRDLEQEPDQQPQRKSRPRSDASRRGQVIGGDPVEALRSFREEARSASLPERLQVLADLELKAQVTVEDALADWIGLTPRLDELGRSPTLLPDGFLPELCKALETIKRTTQNEPRTREMAKEAGEAARMNAVRSALDTMPVEKLKEATRDRLLIQPLIDAGIRTVQAVIDAEGRLPRLPGIGPGSARRISGAAHGLRQREYDETPVRLDIVNRSPESTRLLSCLAAWDRARKAPLTDVEIERAKEFRGLARSYAPWATHVIVLQAGKRSTIEFTERATAVIELARDLEEAADIADQDPWADFMARPADYFAMLAELGFNIEDEEKVHGDLPEEIIEAVRRLTLRGDYFAADLRGYQSFAARFALAQRKVIIGDEMGLGKTVEALAVLAHLHAIGESHFLVICPAAVVTNWVREVQAKSKLAAHRLHGLDRDWAVRNWIHAGGVAVTTFDSLGWFLDRVTDLPDLGCAVVDEAHYVKNKNAKRSQRTSRVLDQSERAILLTGTPLENHLGEFRNLIEYIRPDLVIDADEFSPRRFRTQVAPIYLRRNQEDVLTELPDEVEMNEWLPMNSADEATYRRAVEDGNFMAMRQAAMLEGASAKMERLNEIVEEAEENGRKVIVFSYFRDVLDTVAQHLPGQVFGPLTGSTPPVRRQTLVDDFSRAEDGAALVAQIAAGGVGLNIQAASVVVICEPQLKPTLEWQAIGRARRMGQLHSVQVHRLLAEDSVDQRITEILAPKHRLFDDFARISAAADSAPEAVDISEAQLARQVVASERERLLSSSSHETNSQENPSV